MTVYNELNKIAYIGSSEQTLYPIPFEYISTDDIKVSVYTSNNEFVEDWTYSIQYVIEGGNVKVLSGYNIDNNKKLLILRSVDLIQDNKYREGGDFPAKSTETSFDKLTMITQQLQETLDRCVKVDVLDIQTPEELLQTVYDKLDSATVIAGDAISAANQAQTAADNATAAVNSAEQTLVQTQAYVDSAKVEIDNTKNTAINTINSTVAQAKADVNSAIDVATMDISNTSTAAINTINTAVSNAESNISTIVSDAEGSITSIAVTEANKAIANAAQEATDTAKANVNSYVDGTVKPSLQTYVDQAQADANSAATSMEQAALSATAASNYASNASAEAVNAAESAGLAANSAAAAKVSETNAKASETNALIWAEGTDAQVQALGGEKSAKGWAKASTNLDYTNITNCITEIPQDIKLELKDGTLKLKAGSKVYVPNGANVYNAVTISSDMILPKNSSAKYFIFLKDNGATADTMPVDYCYTGKFQPTITHTYAIWHDTASYKIKWTGDNGSTWVGGYSFPICVIVNNTPGTEKASSIEQVFNGFGYVGKTVFALPGVKGLIPNGRNADGSLKNTEFRYDSVKYVTFSNGTLNDHIVCYLNYISLRSTTLEYDEKVNLNWLGSKYTNEICDAGRLSIDSANSYAITSFTPKTAFHAVDWNDYAHELNSKQDIANLSQTLDDSTTKYPSNNAVKTAIDAKGGGLEIGDIGFAPLGIDEAQNKRRYLNGQVISQAQFVSFTNKIKAAIQLTPSLATSETNWQAEVTNSKLGQCGKFVIDDALGTIRLPKVVNINGLQDLALMGGIKAESLPNIKGGDSSNHNSLISPVSSRVGNYGAVSIIGDADGSNRTQIGGEAGVLKRAVLNASLGSSTYQDNAPVQQEAVQYPYFIQVATGVEESVDVTREIELNNPFSLLDYKWSEYELSNASWLLSNGAFHSGTVYTAVYELLLKIKNGTETKDGVSVKLSTEAYTDTDFVINTADTTFRLPIKVKLASGSAVVGNGMTLGLDNGHELFGLFTSTNDCIQIGGQEGVGQNVGYGTRGLTTSVSRYAGITTDPTKSGIETSSSGLKLYFYVGEIIQDANVIAASQVLTKVANGIDRTVASDRETVVGWGMPDYSAGVSKSNNTQYTSDKDGFLYAYGYTQNAIIRVTINGINMPIGGRGDIYGGAICAFIPISKGDTYKFEGNVSEITFYPCKGAI